MYVYDNGEFYSIDEMKKRTNLSEKQIIYSFKIYFF